MPSFHRLTDFAARRPALAALVLGALAATGFQPLRLWPLALAAMAGFAALLTRTPGWRRAAWLGWVFGLAHFTVGNNWIATAFTYQANMPPALGWAAVPLLSVYLAVWPALAAALARAAGGPGLRWPLALAFAGAWTLAEYLRGVVFTGFPWNPFGIVLLGGARAQGIAAVAPFIGTYALSGLAVALAGAGAVLVAGRRFAGLGILAVAVMAGMLWPAPVSRDGHVAMTLVQPDLRQEIINEPALYEANFVRTAALSRPRGRGPRLLLWPEGGVTDYLRGGYPQFVYDRTTVGGNPDLARWRLGRIAGPGSVILSGTQDLVYPPGGNRPSGALNSVTGVAGDGRIVAAYAKAHLVPYGEYLALRWLLEPLGATRLVPGAMDFVPGPGPRTLDLGPLGKAGVQVCYEIVFSGQVVDPANRPDFLFNPSNDGWFGRWGPPQHLAQARLRAIEEGLPVLRSTTTGISAVIDARGIVRAAVPRHVAGRIDMAIPPPRPPTLFARTGNALPLALAMLALIAALVAKRTGRD